MKLAMHLENFPELRELSSKDEAKRHVKKLLASRPESTLLMQQIEYEKQLQEFLQTKWSTAPFSADWILCQPGKRRAGECGILDLLAKSKSKNQYLVVELKRRKTSDDAVGQILRYMGWVKLNIADDDSEVLGLLRASNKS